MTISPEIYEQGKYIRDAMSKMDWEKEKWTLRALRKKYNPVGYFKLKEFKAIIGIGKDYRIQDRGVVVPIPDHIRKAGGRKVESGRIGKSRRKGKM